MNQWHLYFYAHILTFFGFLFLFCFSPFPVASLQDSIKVGNTGRCSSPVRCGRWSLGRETRMSCLCLSWNPFKRSLVKILWSSSWPLVSGSHPVYDACWKISLLWLESFFSFGKDSKVSLLNPFFDLPLDSINHQFLAEEGSWRKNDNRRSSRYSTVFKGIHARIERTSIDAGIFVKRQWKIESLPTTATLVVVMHCNFCDMTNFCSLCLLKGQLLESLPVQSRQTSGNQRHSSFVNSFDHHHHQGFLRSSKDRTFDLQKRNCTTSDAKNSMKVERSVS